MAQKKATFEKTDEIRRMLGEEVPASSSSQTGSGERAQKATFQRTDEVNRKLLIGANEQNGIDWKITVPTGYQLAEANRQTMNDRAFSIPNAVSAFSKDGVSSRGGGFSSGTSSPNYFSYAERREQWENELRAAQAEKSRLEAGLSLDQVAPVQAEIDRLKGLLRYSDKHYDDSFFGQFQANYAQGRLAQNEAYAWNAYKTSDEAEQNAMDASLALQAFQKGNQEALDDDATLPWISQSLAGYLPQFVDQTKAQIGGGLAGAAAGSLVPVLGTATGAKAGAVAASGLYSYNTMSGAAFKGLVDNGVDVDTARALSQDEAVIDALIEMADTGLDIATLGVGNLISAAAKGSLGAIAKGGAKGAAKNLVNAVRKYGNNALVRYGLNVGGEALEEAAQEAVSIANQERAARGADKGIWDLIKASGDVAVQDVILGRNPENRAQIAQAAAEGAKIAAMMGGATMLGTTLANRALGGTSQSNQTAESRAAVQREAGDAIDSAYAAMLENGMFSQEARQAMDQAGRTMPSDNGRSVQQTAAAPTSTRAQEASMSAVSFQQESTPAMEAYNRSSLSRAAEAFGQQGKQTVQSFYDGQTSPAEYYGAFASYYQAGVNGTNINKVRSSYKSALNEPQRQAAYLAGQMDAAASLAIEKSAVQYATVYGEEAGFVPNEYSKGIDRKTTELYQAIGQATGTKITIAPATGAGGANGWYQNGTVYIAQDAENTGFVVAKHEITHRLQEIAPEQYRQYRDYAVSVLSQGSGSLVEQYRARYAQSGVNLTAEQAMDEIAADFTEALFTDQEKFSRMVQDNRSVARKVLDAVRDFIRKVKKALGLNRADQAARETFGVDLATLEEAERLWSQALDAGSKRAETLREGQADGTIKSRYSLKEDGDHGRAREETGAEFEHRCLEEGYQVLAGADTRYGYRGVRSAGEAAGQVQAELERLGVPCFVKEGAVLKNNGTTTVVLKSPQATTLSVGRIAIDNNITLPPKNVAGHEAFHFWKGLDGRGSYIETVLENLDFTSEAFQEYQSSISRVMFQKEVDLSDQRQFDQLMEEIFAYISGDIHEGTNEAALRPMFRDFDAVRDAWENLVKEHRKGFRFSLKSTDNQGRELTEEQQEFFQDSKIVDENGNLKVMYHGTSADFTVFDPFVSGGKNGTAEGYGLYFADSPEVSKVYGGRVMEGYLNITHPATSYRKTIKSSGLVKLIKATCEAQAKQMVDDGEYDKISDALKDTWVSNYVYTYDISISEAYRQTAAQILNMNDDDMSIVQEVMSSISIRDYEEAYRFYEILGETLGIDGFVTEWESSDESDGSHEIVLAFNSNQFKNVDNKAPTTDPDIRRSTKGSSILQENAALQEENSLLRERVEYWRGQTRRTERVTTDKKAVTRAARELIRSYDADLETADISGDLQGLYDYIASGRDGNDELTYTEARRRADAIARKLVENASVLNDDTYQEYRDLRAYLRNTPLSISEEDSHDIADYGDFRRRNFGRLNLRKGPTNIDQVYQEMSEMWPEYFDEHRHSVPSDQLIHIAEVLDEIYRVTESNPFASYFDAAVADASNEIMERFFDLPQTRETFADRQARKLDDAKARGRQQVERVRQQRDARLAELRQQNRERVQRAIQRERATRARQLERLKTRYAARDAAGRERRNARELRARISRHVADLSRRLLRPSDKQHIPEQLRTAVAAMLDAINMESVYTVDPTTGKRRKGGNGDPTKRTEAFRALREAYANITKKDADYTLVIDPDLMDNLAELESMRDTPLAEMGTGQLSTVWATVKAVEASIRTANRMLGESQFRTISQVAEGIRSDNIMRQDRGNYLGILGRVDKLVNLDMLTPQGYFHRMGPTGDALFHMLRSAQDRHIEIMRSAQEATQDIIGKANVSQMERETHTFDLNGQSVTMSTAQIMTLYELMKRKQAQEHIFVGGIRPDAVQTGRGLRESRRADAVHVSVEDLVEITGVLTEDQIKIADALQKYMGGQLAELGNEASMEVYGYRKFTEPDYFPIQVDRNQISRDISKEANAQTIAGRGFTKSTTPRANNAVMVGSIFDIYASHVNDMATYAAWLPTMENVRRIRDFTYWDSEGNRTGTFKSVIERIFGRNGNAYLNKLVDDLNQGVQSTGTGNFMDGIVSNYKAAAVAANLRVIAQQPTAILRALNILDPKYLLAGTVKRGDWQKVMKYAPIARWKDWGYFDINTGRQMKNVLLGSDSRLEKLRQIGMAGAGKADSFAWARLWNAVEAETKDRRPGLKPGTDAFYRAVGERFSEIVDQTQVVDGILQRSQIMRSTDALTKISTSFMGEPTKSYNMFVNAVYDLHHATGKEARNRAGKALARTSTALVVSFTINAIMQSLVDGLRDDDKETDYWEKVLQAFTGFTGDEETFLDYWNSFWSGNLEASYNPLAYMPYFKDFVSIAQGFDVTRMDMEAVEKVWTSITNMRKALTGEGKYSIAGASANMLAEVARLLGLPVANLKRDIRAVVTTAAIETDNYLLQYEMDKMLLNMGYQGNRNGFMDILYASSVNDPEAYELIYEDMVESGITEEQIRTAMERRMKDAQGVASVDELAQRYLTPSQERTYARLHSQVTSSPVWRAATSEQQKAVDQALYDLTAGTDTGVKMQEKINTGADYGISEVDYLLYLTALEIADAENEDPEKRNGSIDQSEAQIAIDMLTGLLDEGRAYLWQSTNKGWSEKNNPYR